MSSERRLASSNRTHIVRMSALPFTINGGFQAYETEITLAMCTSHVLALTKIFDKQATGGACSDTGTSIYMFDFLQRTCCQSFQHTRCRLLTVAVAARSGSIVFPQLSTSPTKLNGFSGFGTAHYAHHSGFIVEPLLAVISHGNTVALWAGLRACSAAVITVDFPPNLLNLTVGHHGPQYVTNQRIIPYLWTLGALDFIVAARN